MRDTHNRGRRLIAIPDPGRPRLTHDAIDDKRPGVPNFCRVTVAGFRLQNSGLPDMTNFHLSGDKLNFLHSGPANRFSPVRKIGANRALLGVVRLQELMSCCVACVSWSFSPAVLQVCNLRPTRVRFQCVALRCARCVHAYVDAS